jgi:antitoxin ParD1/3/4
MNISLTPRLEKMVQDRVESGLYGSASEVVREALRLFEEHERVREARIGHLREQVLVGVEQLDRGRSRSFDGHVIEAVKTRGRKRLDKPSEA